jgi:hypothetical protein
MVVGTRFPAMKEQMAGQSQNAGKRLQRNGLLAWRGGSPTGSLTAYRRLPKDWRRRLPLPTPPNAL